MHHVDGDYAVQRRIRGGDFFRVAEGLVIRIRGRVPGDQSGVAGRPEAGRGFGPEGLSMDESFGCLSLGAPELALASCLPFNSQF